MSSDLIKQTTKHPAAKHSTAKHIVIVGGGSAGWLTAGLVASSHGSQGSNLVKVTLIESPNIGTIGVGEGTWPSMRATLSRIGIKEKDFLAYCGASFKQGSKFIGWQTDNSEDFYYHPFSVPKFFSHANFYRAWKTQYPDKSFADTVVAQGLMCEQHLAPKQASTPDYAGVLNYGYHLDSYRFAELLKKHCTKKLDVNYLQDTITSVESSDNGAIKSLVTKNSGKVNGDLFIDCSGTTSLLFGKHFNIGSHSIQRYLFNDRALAVQVPYESENSPIASATIATAQSSGWVWDIGLAHRRGVGLVYSSSHCSDNEAEQTLNNYLLKSCRAADIEQLSPRTIAFESGYRKKFWHKNCLAIGMSSGFIEPLEASALAMVEMSASMLVNELPACFEHMHIVEKRFNQRFEYRWHRIADFLKLHYVLSKRHNSPYWQDATSAETTPEHLKELLALWQCRPPNYSDFIQNEEVFPAASYQYVLYGMNFNTELSSKPSEMDRLDLANQAIQESVNSFKKIKNSLSKNRSLLNKL